MENVFRVSDYLPDGKKRKIAAMSKKLQRKLESASLSDELREKRRKLRDAVHGIEYGVFTDPR